MADTPDTGPGALFSTANTKTTLGGLPYVLQNGTWKTELARLRGNLRTALAANAIPSFQQLVSGPWPVFSPFTQDVVGAVKDVKFYYADTGTPQSASVQSNLSAFHTGAATETEFVEVTLNGVPQLYTVAHKDRFFVGGNSPVNVHGTFYVTFAIEKHVEDSTDPLTLVSITGQKWFDGCTWTKVFDVRSNLIVLYSTVNQVVNPGEYYLAYRGTVPASEIATRVYPNDSGGGGGIAVGGNNFFDFVNYPTISLTNAGGATVPAIHSTKSVFCIPLPQTDGVPAMPFGIYGMTNGGGIGTARKSAYPNYQINPSEHLRDPNFIFYHSTTPGIWTARTEPIDSLGMDTTNVMPWNILGKSAGVVVYRNPPFEKDTTPRQYAPNTAYSLSEQILDPHGNLIICIEASGDQKSAPIGGSTNFPEPVFGTSVGDVTQDGSNFSPPAPNAGALKGRLKWRLTHILHAKPTQAKSFSVPRYPYFKFGETNPALIPATQYPQWANFNPLGWWIYRVQLNRVGQLQNGIYVKPFGEIAVTLGCIRNGAFVALGTYQTGDTAAAADGGPLWPIFTTTALCYQAAEYVDVQASVLTSYVYGNTGTYGVGYPIATAHYNDTATLLGLIA